MKKRVVMKADAVHDDTAAIQSMMDADDKDHAEQLADLQRSPIYEVPAEQRTLWAHLQLLAAIAEVHDPSIQLRAHMAIAMLIGLTR